MLVYTYDTHTKEYIGSAYLPRPPANATSLAPPAIKENQIPVYDSAKNVWQITDDFRGQSVYDKQTGSKTTWQELGTLNNKYTTVAPPDDFDTAAYTFDETKNKWLKVELTLTQQKEQAQYQLIALLNTATNDVDNPLLTCILLANISARDLPIKIAKKNLTEIETIADDDAAMSKEAAIRAQLLTRYNKIIALSERLTKAKNAEQLATIATEIAKL